MNHHGLQIHNFQDETYLLKKKSIAMEIMVRNNLNCKISFDKHIFTRQILDTYILILYERHCLDVIHCVRMTMCERERENIWDYEKLLDQRWGHNSLPDTRLNPNITLLILCEFYIYCTIFFTIDKQKLVLFRTTKDMMPCSGAKYLSENTLKYLIWQTR